MKLLTDKQKLAVIEALTSEDVVLSDKERLDEIYRVAHSKKSCRHFTWELEAVKSYKGFKEGGLV